VLAFQLGEQPIDVVDVPRALDLRHHDDGEAVADRADERGEVVEAPGRVQAVHAGPQRRAAQVDLASDAHQAFAGRDLLVGGDRVLEVAEQDVRPLGEIADLGRHLGVARVEEVDHPRRADGDLGDGRGRPDRERLEEISWATHHAFL